MLACENTLIVSLSLERKSNCVCVCVYCRKIKRKEISKPRFVRPLEGRVRFSLEIKTKKKKLEEKEQEQNVYQTVYPTKPVPESSSTNGSRDVFVQLKKLRQTVVFPHLLLRPSLFCLFVFVFCSFSFNILMAL